MSVSDHISHLLLERYHIGEVNPGEKYQIEQAIAANPSLAGTLEDLRKADDDFFNQFPRDRFLVRFNQGDINRADDSGRFTHTSRPSVFKPGKRPQVKRPQVVWMACAAALVLIITLPILIIRNPFHPVSTDRIKGAAGSNAVELSIFLGEQGQNIQLANKSGIQAGNTIQLAYRVQPASSGEKYGVIFSIDGRAAVTLHYPYRAGQSTQLVPGKTVPLNEAYTLDDAPDYEMFFFVVGNKPIDTENILHTAKQLALQIGNKTQTAQQKVKTVFRTYDVQIVTLIKE